MRGPDSHIDSGLALSCARVDSADASVGKLKACMHEWPSGLPWPSRAPALPCPCPAVPLPCRAPAL
eukprot:14316586-Alexandrium_andersonii.AAC.1